MKLTKPTLLLDPEKCQNNIGRMVEKASKYKVLLRPHFKTHQSREIGKWFKDKGIDKITVSSVDMATYFAEDGWKDITIAFPVNINELDGINHLAQKITLSLTVLNIQSIEALNNNLSSKAAVWIKIDTGNKRTGIPHHNINEIIRLKDIISKSSNLRFKGLLAHAGHTYQANSMAEIIQIHKETRDRLLWIKSQLGDNMKEIILSIGDTPSCSISEDFENTQEIRPGNFVFYDMQQYKLNACFLEDIAVCVACPVVAKHKERDEIIIYGGAVHFSKDSFPEGNRRIYGYGVILNDKGWIIPEEKILLGKISQEHGTLYVHPGAMRKIDIGDFIGILPAHSCLTANLMQSYHDVAGSIYDHMKGS